MYILIYFIYLVWFQLDGSESSQQILTNSKLDLTFVKLF